MFFTNEYKVTYEENDLRVCRKQQTGVLKELTYSNEKCYVCSIKMSNKILKVFFLNSKIFIANF